MHPSELVLGDIILYKNPIGDIIHAALYTGDKDGRAYITHSVINNLPGVQTTILRDTGQVIEVFRPRNSKLGAEATKIMLDWTNYRIPYDFKRANWMLSVSKAILNVGVNKNTQEPIDHLLEFLEKQSRIKFYERIKFAARRDTCPVKILDGKEPRGFTCVQAIILAYQIAELAPYVKTISEIKLEMSKIAETTEQINEVWISDKNCPEEILNKYDLPKSYIEYSSALRDTEEFGFYLGNDKGETLTHPNYHPSLVAWRFDIEASIDDFIAKFDSCFNLPAKISFTDSMFGLILVLSIEIYYL